MGTATLTCQGQGGPAGTGPNVALLADYYCAVLGSGHLFLGLRKLLFILFECM